MRVIGSMADSTASPANRNQEAGCRNPGKTSTDITVVFHEAKHFRPPRGAPTVVEQLRRHRSTLSHYARSGAKLATYAIELNPAVGGRSMAPS